MGEAVDIVGAEAAAEAQVGERGIGEHEAAAGGALEFGGQFGQRGAAETHQRLAPCEGLRDRSRIDAGNHQGGPVGGSAEGGAFAGVEGGGVGRAGGELDAALGDDHVDGGGLQIDVERGADGADLQGPGLDNERSGGIFGDGEVGFAAREGDVARGGGESLADFSAGVELHDRAVGERHQARRGGCGKGGG